MTIFTFQGNSMMPTMTCNIDYVIFLKFPFMGSEITEIILQILFVENVTIYNVAAMKCSKPVEQRLCIETESITFVFSIFPFRF